jgi:hypothetical protein
MPARRSYKRHSSGNRPLSECSHTRDVAENLVALFYFSSDARKKTCRRPRPRSSGGPGAGLLRMSQRAESGGIEPGVRCGADRITEIR